LLLVLLICRGGWDPSVHPQKVFFENDCYKICNLAVPSAYIILANKNTQIKHLSESLAVIGQML